MATCIKLRPIGSQGLQAGNLGFGAMGLTAFYGPASKDEDAIGKETELIRYSLDNNVYYITKCDFQIIVNH